MIGAQRQRPLGGRAAVEPRSGEVYFWGQIFIYFWGQIFIFYVSALLFLGSDLYILHQRNVISGVRSL
jgi:hypothetical protein